HRCNCLSAQIPWISFVFFAPESSHLRILHVGEHRSAKIFVDEKRRKVSERCVRLIEKHQQCIAQDVLKPRSPRITPLLLKYIEEGRGRERSSTDRHIHEWIKSEREIRISRVEQD